MLKTHCVSCCIIKQTHQICACFTAHCDTFLAFTSSWGFVLQLLFQNLQCGIFSWGYISRIVCWILINCRHVGPDHWRVMILNEWWEVFNSVLLVSLQWPVWVIFFFFFFLYIACLGLARWRPLAELSWLKQEQNQISTTFFSSLP